MEMKFCSYCGTQLEAGQTVCGACGNAQQPASGQTPPPQQQNQGYPPPPPPYQAPGQNQPYGAPPPYQGYQQPMQYPNPAEQKSKMAAGLLAIFVGAFGVHNFYLGYTGKALAQLLITVLTCGIGAIATGVWSLIEGIMILTGNINVDAKGIPLKE